MRRCADSGLLDSGGGVSHFAAHVVAAFMELGGFDAHVEMLRAAYRARRDHSLRRAGASSSRWLPVASARRRLLRLGAAAGGVDAAALLPQAEAAGVSYVPGSRFCADGGCSAYIRLAFTLLRWPY